jgi:uncharacterized membrane protein YecN with MAPEG domain
MVLPITATVAAICALLLLATGIETVQQRLQLKVAFGDGGAPALVRASRSHGNLAEHAPIVILMLGLLELNHARTAVLASIAATFVVGRIAHIIGLHMPSVPGKAPFPRQIGVVVTWASLAGLASWLLVMLLAA